MTVFGHFWIIFGSFLVLNFWFLAKRAPETVFWSKNGQNLAIFDPFFDQKPCLWRLFGVFGSSQKPHFWAKMGVWAGVPAKRGQNGPFLATFWPKVGVGTGIGFKKGPFLAKIPLSGLWDFG